MRYGRIKWRAIVVAAWFGAPPASVDAPAQQPTTQPAQDAPPPAAATQPAEPPGGEPPPATGPVSRPPWLDPALLSFDLGFDAEYQRRQAISTRRGATPNRFRQLNEDTRFEETLGVRSQGELFGERVARYDVMARYGLSQERFFEKRPGPDLRETPHGDILEYDARLDLLPAGKISAQAFASQLDDRIPRPFLPSLDRRRERYGAGLYFNDAKLPMRLTYEHAFERLTSATRFRLDDEDRRDDTLEFEATWQPTEHHSLRLNYQYDDRREKYSGSGTRFETTRNDLTLDHTLLFGRDHRSRLETSARFEDQTGDLARDTAEVAPQLRLQHSDALATTYKLQYLRQGFEQLKTEQWRGDIGLIHELAGALITTLNLHALEQDNDANADVREWGGLANVSFSRENGLGRFSANLSYSHVASRADDAGRSGVVLTESVTFRDPQPAYLAQRHVERSSLVVTDAARTRTYLIGRDFLVSQSGEYTSLQRVRTGQIVDGQTVLVAYTYRTFQNYDLNRDRVDLRIQQDFQFGLTAYYSGSVQDEDLDAPRFLTWRARNVNRHRVGATFRRPRWSVGTEYEYHDDAIDPYQALHANGDAVLLEKANHQLSARGSLSRFLFDGSGNLRPRDTTLLDLGLSHRCVFHQRFEASGSAVYRWEDDSLFGRTHGVDLSAALKYRIGLFTLLLEAEYDLLDLPSSSDNTFAVWLKLRREIPVIARAER